MGDRDALVIATGTYEDPELRRLRAPAQDAEALTRVLSDPTIGGFQVETIVDQPARVITRAAQRFFADRGLDDLLLLHLSCHGVKDDDGRLYFAASDTERELLAATGISAGFMVDLMEHCRARSIVLLLDCCYSGAFIPGAKGDEGVHLKERFEGEGRAILTASNAIEYSWEGDDLSGEGAPSVFTAAIVDGLESGEADRDRDGMVSVEDLYRHVYDRVRAERPGQTPKKWEFGIEHDLYLARNPRPIEVQPAELPPEIAAALESPLAGVRAGIVDELGRLLRSTDQGVALAARVALEGLRDDDSRRVAETAGAVLGTEAPGDIDQAAAPPVEPHAERVVQEPPERESRGEQERDAPAAQERALLEQEPQAPVTPPREPDRRRGERRGRGAVIGGAVILLAIVGIVGWLATRGPDTTAETGPSSAGPSATGPAPPSVPSLLGSVAYVQEGDVRALDPTTGEDRLVVAADADEFAPSISPDGSQVLFGGAGVGGETDVFMVGADGSGLTNLTEDPSVDGSPDWSPDGSQIVFESDRDGGDYDLFVMDPDGTNVERLTDDPGDEKRPEWSPDGTRIAFQLNGGGGSEFPDVYVMNADGADIRQLTFAPSDDGAPIWAPDGKKILFRSDRGEAYGIWVMNANGHGERKVRIDGPTGNIRSPAWSPDGRRIVFASDQGSGDFDLFVVDADGGEPDQLTTGQGSDLGPTWA